MSVNDQGKGLALLHAINTRQRFVNAEAELASLHSDMVSAIRSAHARGWSKGRIAHELGMEPGKVGKILGTNK